ncbi:peptidoglycan-binding protein [Geitlerinema sp. P-1104]|uniref:peptidoglycan-binding domain-containing protein n=1 Tax=Geitlerinema sp. P-1104 TaxID=2546230 RepID=UPI0014771B9D|nr:peptidoglycan-binding domain-containing protein [Geitlerinema sp. P-1104]NMG59850.1 peptidoglycan-binding protein [Geitlerinema sp. P-1104]
MRDIARQTIQDIIITGTITRSSISLLEDAVSVISQAEWGDISDELGLTLGLEDPAYNRELIYLCTLHALLVPKFLTKFLLWIADAPEYAYQMSITLQGSLRFVDSDVLQHFPNLKKRLESGVRFLFYRLVYKQAELLHPAIKLLTSDWGLWSHTYQTWVAEELKSYLRHMNPYADVDFSFESVSSPLFQELLADIYRFWDDETEPNLDSRYHPLAVVFERTQQPHLAAIFYQISQGYVPKAVVDRLSVVRLPPRLYGLILEPEAGSSFQKADPSTLTPPPSQSITNPPEVDISEEVVGEPETEDPSLDEDVVIPATTENSSPEESLIDEEVVNPAITEKPPANVKPAPPEPTLPPKTALKRMMQRGKVSLDLISSLEYAIPETSKSEWLEMTDALGATTAMMQGIYTDQIVRLYTLQSIVLPNFLPDFLNWLHQSKASKTHYVASLELQKKIDKEISNTVYDFTAIRKQIQRGICIIISNLVYNPSVLPEACLFFSSSIGLWSREYRTSLYPKLENDLSLMHRNVYGQKNLSFQATQYPEWKIFLEKITLIWQYTNVKNKNLLPLAQLFEAAKTPKLAAFFYQVSKGEIPKSIFIKVSKREWQDQLFGIKIKRQIDWEDVIEILFLTNVDIGGIQMTRLTAILLFACFGVTGFIGGLMISGGSSQRVVEETSYELQNELMRKQEEIGSWKKFEQHIQHTQPALEQLQENLTNNLNTFIRNPPQEFPPEVNRYTEGDLNREGVFILFLKEVLSTDEVPYEMIQYAFIFQEKEHGDIFIRAVKYYQERHGLPADGIIDPGGATSQLLEEDIRERLR